MSRILTIIMIWSSLIILAGQASADNFVLAHLDAKEIILELNQVDFSSKPVQCRDGNYHRIVANSARETWPGYPELPIKSALVQVPASGKIAVQVIATSYTTRSAYNIYPVPRLLLQDGQRVSQFVKEKTIYSRSQFFPDVLARIDRRGIIRGNSVARISVYPFQWNPVTRELRHYTRVRLRVVFEKKLAACAYSRDEDSVYQSILKKNIINYRPQPKPVISRPSLAYSPLRQNHLKIKIEQDGFYRLTYLDLQQAGVDMGSIAPETLQLFHNQQEISIAVAHAGAIYCPRRLSRILCPEDQINLYQYQCLLVKMGEDQRQTNFSINRSRFRPGKKAGSFLSPATPRTTIGILGQIPKISGRRLHLLAKFDRAPKPGLFCGFILGS